MNHEARPPPQAACLAYGIIYREVVGEMRDMRQGIREVRLGAAMESRLLLARVRIGVRARGAEFGARCARGCRIR